MRKQLRQVPWISLLPGAVGAILLWQYFAGSLLLEADAAAVAPVRDPKSAFSASPDDDTEQLMQHKLRLAQDVVAALAREDFEAITASSAGLLEVAEHAAWKRGSDPIYRMYSANFEEAAEALADAAEALSVERSTFAYTHMTFSCTACHQHVRGVVRVSR